MQDTQQKPPVEGTPSARAEAERPREAQDPTVVSFEGVLHVPDEDRGGDPYNRTGRFKKVVR